MPNSPAPKYPSPTCRGHVGQDPPPPSRNHQQPNIASRQEKQEEAETMRAHSRSFFGGRRRVIPPMLVVVVPEPLESPPPPPPASRISHEPAAVFGASGSNPVTTRPHHLTTPASPRLGNNHTLYLCVSLLRPAPDAAVPRPHVQAVTADHMLRSARESKSVRPTPPPGGWGKSEPRALLARSELAFRPPPITEKGLAERSPLGGGRASPGACDGVASDADIRKRYAAPTPNGRTDAIAQAAATAAGASSEKCLRFRKQGQQRRRARRRRGRMPSWRRVLVAGYMIS
ncbi:hypothetical protein MKZ38_007260 [Zalerion maritima]|uniref:Uncharacterized protein n=1 Tax=Zalerion maritima TaxID=339359 RepID=A0AAD5RWQ4_9PEZI|nr:hypothetical protein MKZ38_007260 [Zalerion maritima]